MRFTFNQGFANDETTQIANICKEHYQCEGCPIMEQGALKNANTGVVSTCSTVIIRNIQKNGKQ